MKGMGRKGSRWLWLMGAVLAAVGIGQTLWPLEAAPVFARQTQQTLIIDPGHGGEDGGALTADGGKESDINLAIGLQLDGLMGFYGVRTVLTRDADVSIHHPSARTIREKKVSDLHHRVDLICGIEDGTLLSIHQNSYPDARYHGTQVFYGDAQLSQPLARAIQDTIREKLDPENTRKPQHVPSSVYLMNHVGCRAVLVECGFLSNEKEAALLREKAYQQKLAMTLASCYLLSGSAQEGESLI